MSNLEKNKFWYGVQNIYPRTMTSIEALKIKTRLLRAMAKEFESKLAELQQCVDMALDKK